MQREFRAFRERYPWVNNFATWNEANHCGEPTCHRPALVAAYWRKLRLECQRCKILAAELLDMPNMVTWANRFRRHAFDEPAAWGLHNYVEANRFKSDRLRSLLRNVEGSVWLTEVGGLVKRRVEEELHRHADPGVGARTPTSVMRFIFDDVVALDPADHARLPLPLELRVAARQLGLGARRPDRPPAARARHPRRALRLLRNPEGPQPLKQPE